VSGAAEPERFDVAIIGAGIGGLGLAIRLERAGIDDFVLLERGDGVGGTWRHNTYPGATCDVPSHLYSYSFAPNPHWTKTYAAQPEILAYLEDCADRFGIRPHLRTGVTVVGAEWSEASSTWTVRCDDGTTVEAAVVVSALGMLDQPKWPDIAGLDDFAGPLFHSARWDHDVELQDRRVAVIGTGASSVQIVPEVAPVASRTLLFQRSAPHVLPRRDEMFTDEQKALFATDRHAHRRLRAEIYRAFESATAFRLDDPTAAFIDATTREYLARRVADDELRAKLTPDHPAGCKRVLISSGFYRTVVRDDVDVITERIERIDATGIQTTDGAHHDVDVIVLATGFHAAEYLRGMEVVGRGGERLHDRWAGGAHAYLGMAVSGFPNLFLLYGPNTNQGGNSIIVILEAQAAYVVRALKAMRRTGAAAVDVRPDVLRAYDEQIQAAMDGTVWTTGCNSYFTNDHGRVVTQLPHRSLWYWKRTLYFDPDDYDLTPA